MTENKTGFFHMGKVVGVHGIRGIVRVWSYAESLSVFKPGTLVVLKNYEAGEKTHAIKWVKPHKKGALFSFEGITDRTMAEALVGAELFLDKADIPDPEEGAYFWSDIIGLSVYKTDGTYMGCVESIIETGSNDVYVVKNKDNEILIPALEWVVLDINLEEKTMVVNEP
jgi:16S rRNA processing protein RimM